MFENFKEIEAFKWLKFKHPKLYEEFEKDYNEYIIKPLEKYFDENIKPYLIDGNKLECERCRCVIPFIDKISIATFIKNQDGKIVCKICIVDMEENNGR